MAKWAGGNEFRLIEEYVPACGKCGGPMRALEVGEDEVAGLELTCNDCGSPLSRGELNICWD